MLKRGYLVLWMTMVYIAGPTLAQTRKNAFVIDEDQMVLYIDLKLKKADIDSLLHIADIHRVTPGNLIEGNFTALQKEGWTVSRSPDNMLIVSKPLSELANNPQLKPFMVTAGINKERRAGYPGDVLFGTNNYSKQTVHELPSGVTRFFLPGNLTAKKVFLSGNFNSWSTLKSMMLKTDSGWIYDIKLDAGEHLYKFIVNGRWVHDAFDQLKEADGFNDYNSVYFRYNYAFRLKGYAKAARVMLAGSFNNWNANQLVMTQSGREWLRQVYLHEGTHSYRFLVDGKWITDPANANTIIDASGKVSSVINIGEVAVFKLKGFTTAHDVVVSGSFNGWNPNQLHLHKIGGYWTLPCVLPAGNYGYKFVVDGGWMTDPDNPCQRNEGGETNSFLAVKPNQTFVLKGYPQAKSVRLSGTFNDWNEPGYLMAHKGDTWTISVNLKPGKTLYKFIVDGNWIIDPGNRLWEQNQFDTGNSVLWVER